MAGLELGMRMIEERERRLQLLDNPERRHEPDGVVSPSLEAIVEQITPENRHGEVGLPLPNVGTRQSILTEAQGLVHGVRNEAYGHPADDYARTAGMFSSLLAHKLKEPLTPQEAIMFMICVKLSRQVNRPKRDNAVDGAGYFECLDWTEEELALRAGR